MLDQQSSDSLLLVKKIARGVDVTIRGAACVSLVPFGVLSALVMIFSGDDPRMTFLDAMGIMSVAFFIGCLIFVSSMIPSEFSRPFSNPKVRMMAAAVARIPAYGAVLFFFIFAFPLTVRILAWITKL